MHRAVLAVAGLTAASLTAFAGVAFADNPPAPTGPDTPGCAQAQQTVHADATKANAADALVAKVTADLAAFDTAQHNVALAADAYGKVGDAGHTPANLDALNAAKDAREKTVAQLAADTGQPAPTSNGDVSAVSPARNTILPADVKAQTAAHDALDAAVKARDIACTAPPATTTTAAPTTTMPAPTTSAAATTTAAATATGSAANSGSGIPGTSPVVVGAPAGSSGSQVAVVPNGVNTGYAL